MERASITHEERNALILRRTLSAVSWLYASWTAMFGALALGRSTAGAHDATLLLIHAALLALAGILLWKPRRGAVIAALAAAAGSIFFVVVDLRRENAGSAVV